MNLNQEHQNTSKVLLSLVCGLIIVPDQPVTMPKSLYEQLQGLDLCVWYADVNRK